MHSDDRFDELLREAGRENKDLLTQYGPDFVGIESRVLARIRKNDRKRRSTLLLRIAVAGVGALIVLNALLLFMEIEPVKAYQEQVKKLVFNLFSSDTGDKVESQSLKESNEIQKAQRLVPFQIPAPGWVPSGYAFNDIKIVDDGNNLYTVILTYKSDKDNLSVNISNISGISNTLPSADEGEREQVTINGNDVYLFIAATGESIRSKCFFYNKQGLNIYISGSVDKQSLIRIVESMG